MAQEPAGTYLDLIHDDFTITHVCDPLGNVVEHVSWSNIDSLCCYDAFGQITALVTHDGPTDQFWFGGQEGAEVAQSPSDFGIVL